jgi:ligand-binding SRPBCC domain-containing protein
MPSIRVSTRFFAPAREVWIFASDRRALVRLGSERSLHMVTGGPLRVGTQFHWTLRDRFPALECRSQVRSVAIGSGFLCQGVSGSLPAWSHVRQIHDEGESCVLEDRISYESPGSVLAGWVDRRFIRDSVLDLSLGSHRAIRHLSACRSQLPEGQWESGPADRLKLVPAKAAAWKSATVGRIVGS